LSRKEKISSEQQFFGRKCLVNARSQRGKDQTGSRKATVTQSLVTEEDF